MLCGEPHLADGLAAVWGGGRWAERVPGMLVLGAQFLEGEFGGEGEGGGADGEGECGGGEEDEGERAAGEGEGGGRGGGHVEHRAVWDLYKRGHWGGEL